MQWQQWVQIYLHIFENFPFNLLFSIIVVFRLQSRSMEWSGTMSSFSSSLPSGRHMSSTSQWESLVTPNPCDRGREDHGGGEEMPASPPPPPHPGSTSFPVEILLTHKPHVPYTDFMLLSCCFRCCRVLLLLSFLFFTHYKTEKKYYFVRLVLPPLRCFEEFDNLPHFDNGSCVCTLFS